MRFRPGSRLLAFTGAVCRFAALVSAVGRGQTTVTFQQGTNSYTGGTDRRIAGLGGLFFAFRRRGRA
jgi:hypothetical protein